MTTLTQAVTSFETQLSEVVETFTAANDLAETKASQANASAITAFDKAAEALASANAANDAKNTATAQAEIATDKAAAAVQAKSDIDAAQVGHATQFVNMAALLLSIQNTVVYTNPL